MKPAPAIAALALVFALGVIAGGEGVVPYDRLKTLAAGSGTDDAAPARAHPRRSFFDTFHPQVDVVMLGDSLTHNGDWNQIFPGVRLANRGIGGETVADLSARIGTVLALAPRRVFLSAGINDFFAGADVDTVLARHRALIGALRAAGIEVVLQSTIECAEPVCGPTLARIRALNTELVRLARAEGLVHVDLNTALSAGPAGLDPAYSFDGVHLTGPGYAAWARQIAPVIGAEPALATAP